MVWKLLLLLLLLLLLIIIIIIILIMIIIIIIIVVALNTFRSLALSVGPSVATSDATLWRARPSFGKIMFTLNYINTVLITSNSFNYNEHKLCKGSLSYIHVICGILSQPSLSQPGKTRQDSMKHRSAPKEKCLLVFVPVGTPGIDVI